MNNMCFATNRFTNIQFWFGKQKRYKSLFIEILTMLQRRNGRHAFGDYPDLQNNRVSARSQNIIIRDRAVILLF